MGTYKNELVSDETREKLRADYRRKFLETAVMQRHGWIENIGDMTDADLCRLIPVNDETIPLGTRVFYA